jgi:hypothetical protein
MGRSTPLQTASTTAALTRASFAFPLAVLMKPSNGCAGLRQGNNKFAKVGVVSSNLIARSKNFLKTDG